MKICICATGTNLESAVSPVFGRAPYFLIADSKKEDFKFIPNLAGQAGRGAGVGAAQIVASEKAVAVICGNFGPNAFLSLQTAGIKIYPGVFNLSCKEVLDKYKKGELREMKAPPFLGRFGPSGFPGRRGPGYGGRGLGPGPGRRRRGGR